MIHIEITPVHTYIHLCRIRLKFSQRLVASWSWRLKFSHRLGYKTDVRFGLSGLNYPQIPILEAVRTGAIWNVETTGCSFQGCLWQFYIPYRIWPWKKLLKSFWDIYVPCLAGSPDSKNYSLLSVLRNEVIFQCDISMYWYIILEVDR